jgi:pectate lyase
MKSLSIFIALAFFHVSAFAQQLAFPTAEGGGRHTKGGRGGKVIEVTNLNDSGTGSLRAAVGQSGSRTVVFRVSGTISLQSKLSIKNDSITIAGQTAPGDGICLSNYTFEISASQVIIRFIRFRLGDVKKYQDDAVHCNSGGVNYKYNHIIVDHCSATWSLDEALSFYGSDSITVQWCMIGESLDSSYHVKGPHGYGGIEGGTNSTYHHNLYANNVSRNPRFSGPTPAGSGTVNSTNLDFVNNVIYNWGDNSTYGGEQSTINIVNNFYKYGPATLSSVKNCLFNPYGAGDSTGQFYINGNVMYGDVAVTNDNWQGVKPQYAAFRSADAVAVVPFTTAEVTITSAQEAFDAVIQNAGATKPKRDTIDSRMAYEAETGTATYIGHTKYYETIHGLNTTVPHGIIDSQDDVGGWPELLSAPAPADSDHDGMPDDWEIAHGLSLANASDRNTFGADGYTMLEEYLNGLAGEFTPTGVYDVSGIPTKFELMQNYPNPFNPTTTIGFSLQTSGFTSLIIYDMLGREVETVVNGYLEGGIEYKRIFNASHLSSGIYFSKLESGGRQMIKKMIFLK